MLPKYNLTSHSITVLPHKNWRHKFFRIFSFLVKFVEETSRTTGTGRGCQDIKTSLNTMLLRTGFVDSCQSFFFGFLDITSDIQLEQKTKLQ